MIQVNQHPSFEIKANSYSGESSNDGIEVIKVEGNYEQETTNGYQLFDASKLPTKSQGGVTVTNNGDGSFTITGSGNTTSIFDNPRTYTHQESIKLLKVGLLKSAITSDVAPYFFFTLNMNNSILYEFRLGKSESSFNITQSMLDNETFFIRIGCYRGDNSPIIAGTIKPMMYQYGDGTWEPFTGGMPSPNPDYPKEIKSVDISEFNSKKYQSLESQITTLTIPLKLRKLPNGICDTYENGIITRRIGEITFDGSSDESWGYTNIAFYNRINDRKPTLGDGVIRALNDTLNILPPNTPVAFMADKTMKESGDTKDNAIYVKLLDITSVAQLKTWLQSNNLTVWYELATPKTEQFNIPMLPSYYPYTNINHNSPISTSLMIWKIYQAFFFPKTNWTKDDYINIDDFNRIRNNIQYLKDRANEIYMSFNFKYVIENEKTYSDYPYAEVWNNLENCLQDIIDNSYILNVGDKKTYIPYTNYIDYQELNRLESACLEYKKLFDRQLLTTERLSFTLGNYGGVKL